MQRGSITHLRKFIRKTIYRLKWVYGCPVDLYTLIPGEVDPETGDRDIAISRVRVDRAIVFPVEEHKNFFYSISFIKANSSFVTGGDVQVGDRQFIIAGRDLPRGTRVVVDQYLIFDHRRFDIMKVYALEYGEGWFISARRTGNNDTGEIHEVTLRELGQVADNFNQEI